MKSIMQNKIYILGTLFTLALSVPESFASGIEQRSRVIDKKFLEVVSGCTYSPNRYEDGSDNTNDLTVRYVAMGLYSVTREIYLAKVNRKGEEKKLIQGSFKTVPPTIEAMEIAKGSAGEQSESFRFELANNECKHNLSIFLKLQSRSDKVASKGN